MPTKSGGWIRGLPDTACLVINAIASTKDGYHESVGVGYWWLRRSPTTGQVRDAELLLRGEHGRIVGSWPVMVAGELVSPFNGDGEPLPPSGVAPSGRRYRPDLSRGLGVVGEQARSR